MSTKNFCKQLAAALLVAMPLSASANLITNGDFEAGLTGWTCVGADFCAATAGTGIAGSAAAQGFDNDGFAVLSQTIATVPGEVYTVSFFTRVSILSVENQLSWSVSGLPGDSVSPTSAFFETADSFVATSGLTSFDFYFATDPGTGVWLIDNVTVEGAAVPEPGTVALLALGLLGAGLSRKRLAS